MDDAGLLSFATFSWFTPLMVKGYRHTLTVDTLPPLSPYDSSDTNAQRYQDSPGAPQERSAPGRGREPPREFHFPGMDTSPHRSWWPFSVAETWAALPDLVQCLGRGGLGRASGETGQPGSCGPRLWPRGRVSAGLQGPWLGTRAASIPLCSVLGRPHRAATWDLLSKSPSKAASYF